jgi:hypothetical protein
VELAPETAARAPAAQQAVPAVVPEAESKARYNTESSLLQQDANDTVVRGLFSGNCLPSRLIFPGARSGCAPHFTPKHFIDFVDDPGYYRTQNPGTIATFRPSS